MTENNDWFGILTKTDDPKTKQEPAEHDVLSESKDKIIHICLQLCTESKEYKPQETLSIIKEYIDPNKNKSRILYSEITNFVFNNDITINGIMESNIQSLLEYAYNESNNVPLDSCNVVVKIYDHYNLAIKQVALSINSIESAKRFHAATIDEVKDELRRDLKRIEKDYITILGIFASVVLAFMGGISFSSAALENLQKGNVYRVVLVIIMLGLVLMNVVHMLIKFIAKINDKEWYIPNIWKYSLACVLLAGLVVVAWAIDTGSLVVWFRQILPWVK